MAAATTTTPAGSAEKNAEEPVERVDRPARTAAVAAASNPAPGPSQELAPFGDRPASQVVVVAAAGSEGTVAVLCALLRAGGIKAARLQTECATHRAAGAGLVAAVAAAVACGDYLGAERAADRVRVGAAAAKRLQARQARQVR